MTPSPANETRVTITATDASAAEGSRFAQELREELLALDPNVPDESVVIDRGDARALDGGALLTFGIGLLCHFLGVGLGVVLEKIWEKYHKPIQVQFPNGAVLTFKGASD